MPSMTSNSEGEDYDFLEVKSEANEHEKILKYLHFELPVSLCIQV